MTIERRVVDNRVFLLGLDALYREAMKRHERDELLHCARETAVALSVPPADVPIEGYYTEDERLTEYFRLVRALQQVPKARESDVAGLAVFQELKRVTESPIFGPASTGSSLLSVGRDALSAALEQTFPAWRLESLTNAAYACALASSDFSLVALAALSRDAVVLAALRESVILYAALALGRSPIRSEPEYVWEVDEIIQQRAAQFVEIFNNLFGERLPPPTPENAKTFWLASSESTVIGRCVRIGIDDSVSPVRHYHWAIDRSATNEPTVREFWDTQIWTTVRYMGQRSRRSL